MPVSQHDPVVAAAEAAVKRGDREALRRMLGEHPHLATLAIGGRGGGTRTLLHTAADWPGFFPNGSGIVQLLIGAGADPNARTTPHPTETPLHWAASTDDLEVAEALIAGGADVNAPDGSIGTPLANAVGYGCWQVARRLVDGGARVHALWEAAALGMMAEIEVFFAATPGPTAEDVQDAFWQACHGGQPRAARCLQARGATLEGHPAYAKQSPVEVLRAPDTRHGILADMLDEWLAQRASQSQEPRPS